MARPHISTVGPIPIVRTRPIPVVRTERNRPIYVSWTSGVTNSEGYAAIAGIRDVLQAAGVDWEIQAFGSGVWANGDYGCADWYEERSVFRPIRQRHGYGPQVNADALMDLLRQEPWQRQRPHYDVMLMGKDLCTNEANMNFVFGVAIPNFAYLQSVARVREAGEQLELRLIRRTTAHEFGHVLGLPGRRERVEMNLGAHCLNLCAMRQGLSLPIWIAQLEEENRARVLFCRECTSRLRELTH